MSLKGENKTSKTSTPKTQKNKKLTLPSYK